MLVKLMKLCALATTKNCCKSNNIVGVHNEGDNIPHLPWNSQKIHLELPPHQNPWPSISANFINHNKYQSSWNFLRLHLLGDKMLRRIWYFLTSRSSRVNLNGALSKFTPPGELDSMKPKSMCIIWPSSSNKRFPLCLSLT